MAGNNNNNLLAYLLVALIIGIGLGLQFTPRHAENKVLETQVSDLQIDNSDLQDQIDTSTTQTKDYETQVTTLNSDITSLEDQNDFLSTERDRIQDDYDHINSAYEELLGTKSDDEIIQALAAKLQLEKDALQDQVDALSNERDQIQADYDLLDMEYQKLIVIIDPPPPSTYVASINSDKFHEPYCSYVDQIKVSNLVYFDSRVAAVSSGRTPCSRCDP